MDAEIIIVGDEIVSGYTVDTNSAFIARQLETVGLTVKYKTAIGDVVERMEEVFRTALKRADVVITTGGLGPTDDDVTKKAIVKVFKRNLVFHEEILEDLRERYARRGIKMPAINQNQALLPQGATFFPNKNGSAVGICIAEQGRVFIALPGVPAEMQQIMTDEVGPYLKGLKAGQAVKVTSLHTTGIVESKLAEMITPQLKLPAGVRLAYLPAYSGVTLRVTGVGETDDDAADRVAPVLRYLESVCGSYIYGRDDDTLEAVVGQLLKDNDKTLAVAESCTGGGLGMRLTSVPGASAYFVGGVIAYSDDAKINRLAVEREVIDKYGAVSEECAQAMAAGCRKLFESDFALSITGIAGPEGGSEDKPVGTTYIGLASAHSNYARKLSLGRTREANRARAGYAALELLRRDILDIK
ncbi:MAG: competence/damage-inducible protein A [candidate division Zixibacteria bacterium]|nr:competence/damage-inducible protein A [candidate division Zixibacteria bacterium]